MRSRLGCCGRGATLTVGFTSNDGYRACLSFPLTRILTVRVLILDSAVATVDDNLTELRRLRLVLRVADGLVLILVDGAHLAIFLRCDAPHVIASGQNVPHLTCHVES